MKTKINLRRAAIFATPALDGVIIILLFVLTAGSQEYLYHNVTKYTLSGDWAVYMSWLLPFAVESATGVVIFYAIKAFGKKARITSVILLLVFFFLAALNYKTSQAGLISKGLDEVQKTAPKTVERLKEVEDRYLNQLKQVSGNYQISSTSNIDRQINLAEEDLAAIQTETEKCRCPSWSKFQNEQKAKRNAVLNKISRLDDQRISINEQNNLAQKMQAQQTAPIQEAMKLSLKKAEEANEKDEAAFEQRKENKTETIASIHAGISIIIILLSVVKAIVKDEEAMLLFEKSLRTSLVSKPIELKSKKPIDFEQDFKDLIYVEPEYLRLTNAKIAQILAKNCPIDGEISALARNISDWKKSYELPSESVPHTPAPAPEKKQLEKEVKPKTDTLPASIKTNLDKFFSENKTFSDIKTRYMNGEYQSLLPKMKEYWDELKK